MAKTFEALLKAEKESQKRLQELAVFEPKPLPKPLQTAKPKISRQVMEEYHRMKYNILRVNPRKEIKTLLFTSPTEGEGHSTVLTHFAITLAPEGERALLVDANLRNPSLHEVFNLERKNGLTELFFEKSTLVDVIQKTRLNNLSVITCGKPCSNPSSVFESNSLDFHIEEMKAQADWVLFDSPPINSSDDSITLAGKVDGVVMVVEAEKTRWEVAESAKQRIESGKGTILGVVLNNRHFYIPEWIYKTL